MSAAQLDVPALYNELSEYASKKFRRTSVLSKTEVRLRTTALFLLGLTVLFLVLIAIGHRVGFIPRHDQVFAETGYWLIVATGITIYLYGAFPFLKLIFEMRRPVKAFLTPLAVRDQRDYEQAARLSAFDEKLLKFAAKRLRSQADHLRARLAIPLGALERTGFFPLLLAFLVALWKLKDNSLISSDWIFPAVIAVLTGYILSIPGVIMSHRLEELAQIVDLAVDIRASGAKSIDREVEQKAAAETDCQLAQTA